MRMLLGLAAPTSGRALVLGRPYADLDRPALSVGAVLEATDFHPVPAGRDHLITLRRHSRLARRRGVADRRAAGGGQAAGQGVFTWHAPASWARGRAARRSRAADT